MKAECSLLHNLQWFISNVSQLWQLLLPMPPFHSAVYLVLARYQHESKTSLLLGTEDHQYCDFEARIGVR